MEILLALVVGLLATLVAAVVFLTRAVFRVADEIRRFHGNSPRGDPPGFKVSSLLTLFLSGAVAASSPAEAAAAAVRDLESRPADARKHVRYLSLYHIKEPKLLLFHQRVLDFWLNSLSREGELTRLAQVQPDLYRLDLRDYGIDSRTWEKLDVEPYFHAKIQFVEEEIEIKTPWPGGKWKDGIDYPAGSFVVVSKEKKRVAKESTAAAPWLEEKVSAALITLSGSQTAIVRGDWFIVQTGQQADRKGGTGYYDFLGVKDRKEFQALVGLDQAAAERLHKETRAIVTRSGVALNNRQIIRFATLTGAYWATLDSNKSTNGNNAARQLDVDYSHVAEEVYGTLPNGLFAFFLANAQGVRQDSAPDSIASDGQAPGTDRRVHAGVSCVRCHVEGIRPVNDWARRVYRAPLALASPDYDKLKRLQRLYLSDLERSIKRDQSDYAEALHKVTALKPAELARTFARVHATYTEDDLGSAELAAELGVSKVKLLAALQAASKATGGLDPVLASLLHDPPVPLRREYVEESFSLVQTTIRSYGK